MASDRPRRVTRPARRTTPSAGSAGRNLPWGSWQTSGKDWPTDEWSADRAQQMPKSITMPKSSTKAKKRKADSARASGPGEKLESVPEDTFEGAAGHACTTVIPKEIYKCDLCERKYGFASFLAYVHDIDFSPLQPHDRLNDALHRLDGRKIIFTNADTPYAKRVMAQLGIDHHFEEIYDIVAADYVPKPYQPAYDLFLERHPFAPDRAIFFEDIARNLGPASEMGMVTVWVQNDGTWDLPGNDTVTPDYETSDLAEWLHAVLDNR